MKEKTTNDDYRDEHLERYTQPYRTVAQVLSIIPPRIRRIVGFGKSSRIWFRLFCKPLGPFCALPDVLLIGASKCGTSSMAAHLSSHPDCLPPFFKEVRYFDSSRVSTLNDYRAHFPTVLRRRAQEWLSGRTVRVGDFSPTYFDHPHAPRRARELLGKDIRLILMLRNPVDRAFSQYRFQKGRGGESETTFEQALDLEASRLRGEEQKMEEKDLYFSRKWIRFGYVARGHYLRYLKNWHSHFDPAQLLIVRFEDFQADPRRVFDEICDFLNLSRHPIERVVHNPSRVAEQLSPETRSRLVEAFREPNRRLCEYLKRDFGWDR